MQKFEYLQNEKSFLDKIKNIFQFLIKIADTSLKVQAHSSSEPPLEYNQDHETFDESKLVKIFLTILEILCSFRLVPEEKTDKVIPKSSRLEFLEKFLANSFSFSDAKDSIYGPLNRESTADLPLVRTLLVI